jgi:hypothetical protein
MAELTAARSNALPYPVYGVPWVQPVILLDADGDLVTGAAGLDSEVSKNFDTAVDCTNEATEVGSTARYYLILTAAEMTADVVDVTVKTSTSGAKNTPISLFPRKLVSLRSGTAAGGAAGSITLDSGASAIDDAYNGCLVVGTLDGNVEARIITDYNGSTKVATVVPDWVTTPDSDDAFVIYVPEGMQMPQADLRAWIGVLPLALSAQQVQAIVPNTQKVDVETVKTRAVSAAGAVVVGGFVGQDTAAIGVNASGHVSRVTVTDAVTAGVTLAAAAVTAIWAALTSALTTVGSIGKLLVDNLNATVGSRATQTTADAIEADTQDIQSRLPAALGANGNIKADLRDMIGVAQSVTDLKDFADDGYDPSTNKVQGVVLVDTTTTLTNAPSDSAGVTTLLSRLSALRAGYLDNLSAGAAALESSLQGLITTVGVAGAGLTAADDAVLAAIAALNNLSQANVRTALGMATNNLDTQLAAIAAFIDTEVASILAKVNNLPSDPADASDIAASFTSIASTLTTIQGLVDDLESRLTAQRATNLDNLDATVSSRATPAQVATELATYDGPTKAELDSAVAPLATAAGVTSATAPLSTASALATAQTAITAIKAITDALTAAAAAKLAASALGLITGTIDTAGFVPTVTEFEADDITEATADHYLGRIVTFTSGALLGQSTDITGYSLIGGRGHLTVTALTDAPSDNETFVIS